MNKIQCIVFFLKSSVGLDYVNSMDQSFLPLLIWDIQPTGDYKVT